MRRCFVMLENLSVTLLLWRKLEIHQSQTLSKTFAKLHCQKRLLTSHILSTFS